MYTATQWIRSNPQIPRSAEQKQWFERMREGNTWKPSRANQLEQSICAFEAWQRGEVLS